MSKLGKFVVSAGELPDDWQLIGTPTRREMPYGELLAQAGVWRDTLEFRMLINWYRDRKMAEESFQSQAKHPIKLAGADEASLAGIVAGGHQVWLLARRDSYIFNIFVLAPPVEPVREALNLLGQMAVMLFNQLIKPKL